MKITVQSNTGPFPAHKPLPEAHSAAGMSGTQRRHSDTTHTSTQTSRFSESDFDWFKTYAEIAPLIRELVPDTSSRILMLGCGNSKLSEEV
jgi:hypothetical protein